MKPSHAMQGTGASACSRCAAHLGRSCCEAADDEPLATLTWTDVARIQLATHLDRSAFVQQEVFSEAEARAYEGLRPGWRGYFRQGTVRLSLARSQGACVFLDRRTGCRLAANVRPTACLLYPLEPGEATEWSLAVERDASVERARASGEPRCLAVEEADGRGALLRAFGHDAESLEALRTRLRAEVRAHGAGTAGSGRRTA